MPWCVNFFEYFVMSTKKTWKWNEQDLIIISERKRYIKIFVKFIKSSNTYFSIRIGAVKSLNTYLGQNSI